MNIRKMVREGYVTYLLLWLMFTSRYPIGSNVYDKSWDILIVLDTCRVDALQEIKEEYEFIEGISSTWSVGSTSKEWIEQTFNERYYDEVENTVYISGNPFSNALIGERDTFDYGATTEDTWIEDCSALERLVDWDTVDGDDFGHIEFLLSGKAKTIQPRPVTNHTIEATRSSRYDNIIAHYMQPHTPYYSSSKQYDQLNDYEKYPFEAIRNNHKSKNQVWKAYLDNLRYVLDDIELLINNVEGKVAITADHGELFGECGMYYHHAGNIHPKLKRVPWVEVEASDEKTHIPDVELEGRDPESLTEDQLKALGYM